MFDLKKRKVLRKGILPALALVLLFNLVANSFKLYKYSYDAYTHIFFASHYMRGWNDLWEPRWYGGFPITSYPPLVHQLTALFGFLVGLEISYQILCTFSAILLVLSLFKVASVFLAENETWSVAIVASAIPSLYLTLYVFGQLPTIFASAFSFFSAYTFYKYLLNGGKRNLLITSLSVTLVAASHHFTFFFFLPMILGLTLLIPIVKAEICLKTAAKRLLIAFVVSAALVLLIMEPFFIFLFSAPTQVEIPHASRGNIFGDVHSLLFFWGVYGFTIFLAPIGFLIALKRKDLIPLLVVFVFLFFMGLGGVSPLPRLLLGNLWYLLTYDRFAIWASFLLSIFLGIILKDAGKISEKYYPYKKSVKFFPSANKLKAGLVIGIVSSSIFTMYLDSFVTPRPVCDQELEKIAYFLEVKGDFRYMTFGLNQGALKLTSICSTETIDGGYNTARRLPVLIHSGVERIDNTIYFPNRTDFLNALLKQSAELGVKWVITNTDMDEKHLAYYNSSLKGHGFAKLSEEIFRETSIEIWQYEGEVKTEMIQQRDHFNNFQIAIWSIGPLSALVVVSLLLVTNFIRKDK